MPRSINERFRSWLLKKGADAEGEPTPFKIWALIAAFDYQTDSPPCDRSEAAKKAAKAAEELARIGPPAVAQLVAKLGHKNDNVWMHVVAVLHKIGAPAVEPLLHKLNCSNRKARAGAAKALGLIGDARAFEPLMRALQDVPVEGQVAVALGKIHDRRAFEALAWALSNAQYDGDRSEVIEALGELGDVRAVEPLIGYLTGGDVRCRKSAATALAKLGDERAVEPLIRCLETPEYLRNSSDEAQVRIAAAKALGNLGDARATKPLVKLLWDKEAAPSAGAALASIGAPAVPVLVESLRSLSGDAARHAKDALSSIGEPAVEPLIQALSDKDSEVRSHAAETLGLIGDCRAVEPLIRALTDDGKRGYPYYTVARAAARALGKVRDPRAVEPLIAAVQNPEPIGIDVVAEVLGELGDPRAVDKLIGILPRESAVQALARMRDSRTVEPFLRMLSDTPAGLLAATALCDIGDPSVLSPVLEFAIKTDWKLAPEAILNLCSKNRPRAIPILNDIVEQSKSIRVRRGAAEVLVRLREATVNRYLPKIILDWLEFTSGERPAKDDGLKLMADFAGMDVETLSLAMAALSYTTKISGVRSETLEGYSGGMDAVVRLCDRRDAWSSSILYRVGQRKDVTIWLNWCFGQHKTLLTFEKERQAAQQELRRRRLRDTDPINLLSK